MTPEDRAYLIQISNMLLASGRHCDGKVLDKKEVYWHAHNRPEEDVFIQLSHLAAMDVSTRLLDISIRDRVSEGEVVPTGADQ